MKGVGTPGLVKPLTRGGSTQPRRSHTKVSRFFRKLTDDQVASFVTSISGVLAETTTLDAHRIRMACMLWVEAQP